MTHRIDRFLALPAVTPAPAGAGASAASAPAHTQSAQPTVRSELARLYRTRQIDLADYRR